MAGAVGLRKAWRERVVARLARWWGMRLRSWATRRRLAACGPHLWIGSRVRLVNLNRMVLGDSVVIERDCLISAGPGGTLRIGDLAHLAQGCVVACGDGELTIGPLTIVGEYSSIRTTNHGMARDRPIRFQEQTCTPISIGRDVWVGRGCAILAGVTIGDGAVVGANSVVTGDVAPYTIVAGNPARFIRARE